MGQGFVPIPATYCSIGAPVARSTHPELFPVVFVGTGAQTGGPLVPRLHRGHDVSGHIFLLTFAALFLADQLRQTRSSPARLYYARGASGALLSLWIFSLWVTSAFFHVPSEKLSGFGASLGSLHLRARPITNLKNNLFDSSGGRVLCLFSDPTMALSQASQYNSVMHAAQFLGLKRYDNVPSILSYYHLNEIVRILGACPPIVCCKDTSHPARRLSDLEERKSSLWSCL
jgi:hypothetical protein